MAGSRNTGAEVGLGGEVPAPRDRDGSAHAWRLQTHARSTINQELVQAKTAQSRGRSPKGSPRPLHARPGRPSGGLDFLQSTQPRSQNSELYRMRCGTRGPGLTPPTSGPPPSGQKSSDLPNGRRATLLTTAFCLAVPLSAILSPACTRVRVGLPEGFLSQLGEKHPVGGTGCSQPGEWLGVSDPSEVAPDVSGYS